MTTATDRLYEIHYLPTARSRKVCITGVYANNVWQARKFFRQQYLPLAMPMAEFEKKRTFKLISIMPVGA